LKKKKPAEVLRPGFRIIEKNKAMDFFGTGQI